MLSRLGYKGGLKGCEKQLGLDRHELDGVDGYTAVLLWQEYTRTRNTRALDTLLAYNIQDVLNLRNIDCEGVQPAAEADAVRILSGILSAACAAGGVPFRRILPCSSACGIL